MTEPAPVSQPLYVEPRCAGPDRDRQLSTEDQFRQVYDAHFAYVWSTLKRLGVRDRDLEDLAHDLFVAVYKRMDDYDQERPVRPWLFGFAFRLASDYRRRARHGKELVHDDLEAVDSAPGADQQIASLERKMLVHTALESLNLDRRAVFVMHDLDGMAMPEAAAVLQIPLNTAYSRLRLARDQFTSAIRRLQSRGGGA